MSASLLRLDPTTYQPHPVHASTRNYTQTNCYTDVVIELLHAHGHEPLAVLVGVLGVEWEGDQFTFFKPEPAAVRRCYGIDIHEMQPYRPLVEQACEQLARGRTLLVEADSWYLPDTAATSYRRQHVKSTIALDAVDADAQRAVYFHNAGLYELTGEDFRGALRVDVPAGSELLPPYTELVRFDARQPLAAAELRSFSGRLLAELLAGSHGNPVADFTPWFTERVATLAETTADEASALIFATLRMLGAAADLGAAYAAWLGLDGEQVVEPLGRVAQTCATLSFRTARRRTFDPSGLLEAAAQDWEAALGAAEAGVPAPSSAAQRRAG